MLKKTIKYVDYDGTERTEDAYFNLSKAELADLEMTTPGGFSNLLTKLTNEQDNMEIYKIFKHIVLMAYGEKADNGKRFKKSKKISKRFSETEAYSELMMEFFTNPEAAAKFIEGITPKVEQK